MAGAAESECGYLIVFTCGEHSLFFLRLPYPLSPRRAAAKQEKLPPSCHCL